MERELQQLLIIVAVIAFSLLDLFLRWAKKKAGGAGQRPLPPMDDEAEFEPYTVTVPWPLPDAPPARRAEPVATSLPVRQKLALPQRSGDSAGPRRLAAAAARKAAQPVQRARRPGGVVHGVADARRAVVLAAVFGPPRAVDEYR
jgi:hypothetical protein